MKKILKESNPENDPYKADLIKFYIHLNEYTLEPLVHKAYISEKILRIIDKSMIWHQCIENAYETGSQYEAPKPDLFTSGE